MDLGLEHDHIHWTHLCLTRWVGELYPRYYAFVPEFYIRFEPYLIEDNYL